MGEVALVTGGGTGIGRGIALALARRGVDVALAGRRPEPLEAVAEIVRTLGVRAAALPADITDAAARRALVDRVHLALGPVAILVNNAGILASGSLSSLEAETVQLAVATNLTAPIELTRLLLDDLAAHRGSVVLVASTMSRVPLPYATLYSATKAGLAAFGTALRYELAPRGVHVLIAYPPGADTALVQGMARRSGGRGYRLADPDAVGERIVRALIARRSDVAWGAAEQLLDGLNRISPRLVQRLLASQRTRFERMMSPGSKSE